MDKLKELFESLVDLEKIDELGDNLGLPLSEKDKFLKNYHSPTQRKEAYLELYVHHHPCPSWRLIADLLSTCGLPQQADFVEKTYVKSTFNIYQLLSHSIVQLHI